MWSMFVHKTFWKMAWDRKAALSSERERGIVNIILVTKRSWRDFKV